MTGGGTGQGAARQVDWSGELKRVERVASMLDSRFRLPGTRLRFGLDTIVGLVPGIGDTLTALPSAWIVWKAHDLGVPRSTLARMAANSGLDFMLGSVPVLGDVFDFAFKANIRNLELLRTHVTERLAAENTTVVGSARKRTDPRAA